MFVLCLLASVVAFAQTDAQPQPPAGTQANPFSTFNKGAYGFMQDVLVRSAEKMPEENYNFRPTDAVRTYGQIVGHIADSQYYFCSSATGQKNPAPNIEKTKTTKADLVAALKESIDYCNKAYASMTDAAGTEPAKFRGMDVPRLGLLTINLMHDDEHYGNLVTYMRMKNIVPPSSEQPAPAQPAKK